MTMSRRSLLAKAAAGLAVSAITPAFANTFAAPPSVSPALLARAIEALKQHADKITQRDVMAIVDFALPSHTPRFHIVDVEKGSVSSHLVAHGRGSDPAHTGWLHTFSNLPRSHASSSGTYCTEEIYGGTHGRSIRLSGLDPTNSNAMDRAIVVHPASYVNESVRRTRGTLGRSYGCFVFSDSSIDEVLARLGPGRMIYADKVA
jgi:hypothetical protein